tara:strand:+ start:170 stop:424 length:255 start_codon:yes stop_codon:yes gene_type:complete
MKTCPLSKFRNILGVPKKGVHKYRFLNTALVDYILTIALAALTTYLTKIPLVLTTIGWFIIGIVCHLLFGVETNTLKFFGVSCN